MGVSGAVQTTEKQQARSNAGAPPALAPAAQEAGAGAGMPRYLGAGLLQPGSGGVNKQLGLQAKLKITDPGDVFEQEANRIADRVMALPLHSPVRSAPSQVQRYSGQPDGRLHAAPGSVGRVLANPGRPLEPALRQSMEQRFGHDFSQVRVHTGAMAEGSAQAVNADAYTVGPHIVFGAGQYAPDTLGGQRLLAHELVHTIQQNATDSPAQAFAPSVAPRSFAPASIEQAAGNTTIQRQTRAGGGSNVTSVPRPAPRVPSEERALLLGGIAALGGITGMVLAGPESLEELAALRAVIELKGMERFEPSTLLGNYIKNSGPGGALLAARFSTVAAGDIVIRYANGGYQTDLHWLLPMNHPGLHPRDRSRTVGLMVRIKDGIPSGWIGVVGTAQGGLVTDSRAITGEDPELWAIMFGRSYHGPDSVAPSNWENKLENGELKLATTLHLYPPDGPPLWGLFSLYNEQVHFSAAAEVVGPGLAKTNIIVKREPTGLIAWRKPIELDRAWQGHGIKGQVQASFVDGSFEARARLDVAYPAANPRLRGTVNAVATSVERAWAIADQQNPAAEVMPGLEPVTPATGLALVGWGALDLRITEGLNANAVFLVDPEGHLTVRGLLRAPREIELIKAYPWHADIFKDSWELTDIPLFWGVSGTVTAGVTVDAGATIGPVTLRDIVVKGLYSTRPGIGSLLDLSASLNASLEAWLQVSAWLEGAIEVGIDLPQYCLGPICTPDLDIDVVSARAALTGKGILRAYADLRPRIVRFGATDPAQEAIYAVAGHLEVGGQFDVILAPEFSLGSLVGRLAKGTGPRFNFGGGKYPIAGGAIALDFEHVFGGTSPKPVFTFAKVPFDARKFVKNLTSGGPPPKDLPEKGKYVDLATGKPSAVTATPAAKPAPSPEPVYDLPIPFEIADHQHTLWLKLSEPQSVDVQSPRKHLSDQLAAAKTQVEGQLAGAGADREPFLRQQALDLGDLIKAARDLEEEAKRLGKDPTDLSAADLPDFADLALQLAEYGERYGDADLTGAAQPLPTAEIEPTVVQPPVVPPGAPVSAPPSLPAINPGDRIRVIERGNVVYGRFVQFTVLYGEQVVELTFRGGKRFLPVSAFNSRWFVGTTGPVPIVYYDSSVMKEICDNILDAFSRGKPRRLHYVADSSKHAANRRAALRGKAPAGPGRQLDEYPFASTSEGGAGSVVASVPEAEQRIQGGVMSNFYSNLEDGDEFEVQVQ